MLKQFEKLSLKYASRARRWSSTQSGEKRAIVPMFPYPSGALHMGHVRVYTISDVIARYNRLSGMDVVHPMGWDAFGLPAENAAIDRGIQPSPWTLQNIEQMRLQMEKMDLQLDWDRELRTCDPSYYRWTQWIFVKLFEHKLVDYRDSLVNWDPVDQTVIANEQVDGEGKSWRSGAKVEKRNLKQWFIRTTRYAQELYDGLDSEALKLWPAVVVEAQRKWIKPSKGHFVDFIIMSTSKRNPSLKLKATVFTTRLDTLSKVTFLAISETHELAIGADKSCPLITGARAQNPLTGSWIPIYVADYVVSSYGTNAVMGVPTEDERDFAFAQKYGIPMTLPETDLKSSFEQLLASSTVRPTTCYRLRDWLISRQRYWGTPIPIIHCEKCGPVPVPETDLPVILPIDNVQVKRHGGSPLKDMHDWISAPCPKCGMASRRETDTMDTFVDSSWYYFRYFDPKNNEKIFDSERVAPFLPIHLYVGGAEHSILHLLYTRFIAHFFHDYLKIIPCREPFRRVLAQGMVLGRTFRDPRNGMIVHPDDVLIIKEGNVKEGKGEKVQESNNKRLIYVKRNEKEDVILNSAYEKMSKSKYNGINPESVLSDWNSDVMRLFMVYKSHPELDLTWDSTAIIGMARFLQKLETVVLVAQCPEARFLVDHGEKDEVEKKKTDCALGPEFDLAKNGLIEKSERVKCEVRKVYEETFAINAAIVALSKFLTYLTEYPYAWKGHSSQDKALYWQGVNIVLKFLYPIIPGLGKKLLLIWHGNEKINRYLKLDNPPIFDIPKPSSSIDIALKGGDLNRMFPLIIQVNGTKVKQIMVQKNDLESLFKDQRLKDFALQKIQEDPNVIELAHPASIKRVIIPRKFDRSYLVNFVLENKKP